MQQFQRRREGWLVRGKGLRFECDSKINNDSKKIIYISKYQHNLQECNKFQFE